MKDLKITKLLFIERKDDKIMIEILRKNFSSRCIKNGISLDRFTINSISRPVRNGAKIIERGSKKKRGRRNSIDSLSLPLSSPSMKLFSAD